MHAQSLSHVRLFVTLWAIARQSPLSMGFPRQEYWSGLPFSSPGELPDPVSPALAGGFFTTSTTLSHPVFANLLLQPQDTNTLSPLHCLKSYLPLTAQLTCALTYAAFPDLSS